MPSITNVYGESYVFPDGAVSVAFPFGLHWTVGSAGPLLLAIPLDHAATIQQLGAAFAQVLPSIGPRWIEPDMVAYFTIAPTTPECATVLGIGSLKKDVVENLPTGNQALLALGSRV